MRLDSLEKIFAKRLILCLYFVECVLYYIVENQIRKCAETSDDIMSNFEVKSFFNGKVDCTLPVFRTKDEAAHYIFNVIKAIKDKVTENLFEPYRGQFLNSQKIQKKHDMSSITFTYTVNGKTCTNYWEINSV